MNDDESGVLDRVTRGLGGMEAVNRLAALSGSDFASVMLEVVRRRAARETPATVLRRYKHDRFVRPGSTSWRAGRRAEDMLLGCLPADVEVVTLAPLVPLGTHSALGTVSQHKVMTAIRACEVAADPTNALALEAAARRAGPAHGSVCLAAIQRVVRAQRFPAGWSAHFSRARLLPRRLLQSKYAGKRHASGDRRWRLHRLDRQAPGKQEGTPADQRLRPRPARHADRRRGNSQLTQRAKPEPRHP
jgi:hypothetical protein